MAVKKVLRVSKSVLEEINSNPSSVLVEKLHCNLGLNGPQVYAVLSPAGLDREKIRKIMKEAGFKRGLHDSVSESITPLMSPMSKAKPSDFEVVVS